jgi:hypothetical protein
VITIPDDAWALNSGCLRGLPPPPSLLLSLPPLPPSSPPSLLPPPSYSLNFQSLNFQQQNRTAIQ